VDLGTDHGGELEFGAVESLHPSVVNVDFPIGVEKSASQRFFLFELRFEQSRQATHVATSAEVV
jgi:hypothetical protein